MQVEVTGEDREAAEEIIYALNDGSFNREPVAAILARHREAARIEGIRLGLEAAAGVAQNDGNNHDTESHAQSGRRIATAIRAIDPAVIGAG